MTDAATQDRKRETEFANDDELIRRLGLSRDYGRKLFRHLDDRKTSGFPKKLPLLEDKRHWPAVREFFRRQAGIKMAASEKGGSDD